MFDASYSKALSRRASEGELTEGEIKSFLLNGGDIDEPGPNTGKTILHYAVEHGHIQIALDLIKYGASVNIKDVVKNKTPLDYASNLEQTKQIVEAFVSKKVAKDFPLNEGEALAQDKINDLTATITQYCKQIHTPQECKPRDWQHLIADVVNAISTQFMPEANKNLLNKPEALEEVKRVKQVNLEKEAFVEA